MTSEKSGVTGANQIRPCRNSQGPDTDKSTYKLDFEEIRPFLEPVSTEVGETRDWSTPTRRKVRNVERSSGSVFLLAGMWTVCADRRGEDQGTWTHLASQSSSGVYSPNTWRSGHGGSLLGQLTSPLFFTGTKVEFRLQLAFLPHSPSSFAAVAGTRSNKDWKQKPPIHHQGTSRGSRVAQCHCTALSHRLDGSTSGDDGEWLQQSNWSKLVDACVEQWLCALQDISSPLWASMPSPKWWAQ